tara:strand:- start:218 stop:2020 length:1803 start_codon:yes stop_codon:yes gene_type:complete
VKKSIASLILFSSFSFSNYIPESNQPLYQLQTNANDFQGELAYEVSDDGVSPAIDLSFNFNFYDQTFDQARMATNGCLHFKTSGAYCNDYTPDPLTGQHTYTMYPFWTDLIRDTNARMKSWGDSSKMIFGWYELREYNRSGSDNSFEIILWPNNTFEYRYGDLDIERHDVLIGEAGNSTEKYTYLFYDECNTGSTNTGTCVNVDWNNSLANSGLESGGSLYGVGSGNGNSIDCSNPLNDMSCANYWEAFDDQQCDLDPQYAPFCAGYRFEQDISYFVQEEEFDYGFVDEQDLMAMGTFIEEPEVFFYEEELFFEPMFREEEVYLDPLPNIYELPIELVALTPFEQPFELTMRLEEEFFPEEIIELIELEEVEEYFEPEYEEELEEIIVEAEEPEIEEVIEIEVEAIAVGKIDEKSGITQTQLDVVAQTVSAAANSVSGTTAGTEIQTTSSNSFDVSISVSGGMQNITELGSETVVTTTTSVAVNNTEKVAVDGVQQVEKSEADTIADNIIAQNLEDQAEQVIEERATTDEYGDEANLITYINYLPGFDMYTKTVMLDKTSWYKSKVIYPVSLVDNTAAFTNLSGNSFNKLNKMINLQPNL